MRKHSTKSLHLLPLYDTPSTIYDPEKVTLIVRVQKHENAIRLQVL